MSNPEDALDTETLETSRRDLGTPERDTPERDRPSPEAPDDVSTVTLETGTLGAADPTTADTGTSEADAGVSADVSEADADSSEVDTGTSEADADAPETDDVEAEDAESRSSAASPSRRWLRVCAVLVVVACVLAVTAVGAEHVLRSRIESVVHGALPGLSEDAVVDTGGLVLPQVLAGSLDSLSVSGSQLSLEQSVGGVSLASLDLHDVTATLSGVDLAEPHNVDALDASGTITWEDLAVIVRTLSPKLKDVSLAPDELGTVTVPGTFTATAEVFGTDVDFLVVPSLTSEGNLIMTATEATFGGITFDLTEEDSLTMRLLGSPKPEFVVDHGLLPSGTTFSAVVVTQEGLRVAMSGQDLDLAPGH